MASCPDLQGLDKAVHAADGLFYDDWNSMQLVHKVKVQWNT